MSAASSRPPAAPEPPDLDTIYRRESSWLARQLRRRFRGGSVQALEDLVQDAFLRLADAGAQPRHPRALLLKIASRLALDAARQRERRERADAGASAEGVSSGALGGAEEALLLKQVILSLPPLHRHVFVLSRFEGLTYPEIAEHLGVPIKTVEWRMSQALAHCARTLRR